MKSELKCFLVSEFIFLKFYYWVPGIYSCIFEILTSQGSPSPTLHVAQRYGHLYFLAKGINLSEFVIILEFIKSSRKLFFLSWPGIGTFLDYDDMEYATWEEQTPSSINHNGLFLKDTDQRRRVVHAFHQTQFDGVLSLLFFLHYLTFQINVHTIIAEIC